MNHKAKLILSIISVVLVALLLTFGIIISFIAYKYTWNSIVDLKYVPNDVSLKFEANINNKQTFTAIANNGNFDNSIWHVPTEETTFSKQKRDIVLNFKFTNRGSARLAVNVSGILDDSKQRFTTTALNSSGTELTMAKQPNGTMTLSTIILEGGEGQTIEFSLRYSLVKTNMSINGTENDTQHLSITISILE